MPPLRKIVSPAPTSRAARRPIVLFSDAWRPAASRKGGSARIRRARIAPPWVRSRTPRPSSSSRSRRIVTSETRRVTSASIETRTDERSLDERLDQPVSFRGKRLLLHACPFRVARSRSNGSSGMTEQERVCSFPTVNARPARSAYDPRERTEPEAERARLALVKQIPNPQGSPGAGARPPSGADRRRRGARPGRRVRAGARAPADRGRGGEVTVLSMGPEEVGERRPAGAGDGRRRRGPRHGSGAPRRRRPGDRARARRRDRTRTVRPVVAGAESTDGYTGTVPVTVAELLGVPSVTAVRSLEVAERGDPGGAPDRDGHRSRVVCPLPALVTVTAGATEPRYPSLKGIMGAKQKPLERLSLADLGISPDAVAPRSGGLGRRCGAEGRGRGDRRGRRGLADRRAARQAKAI